MERDRIIKKPFYRSDLNPQKSYFLIIPVHSVIYEDINPYITEFPLLLKININDYLDIIGEGFKGEEQFYIDLVTKGTIKDEKIKLLQPRGAGFVYVIYNPMEDDPMQIAQKEQLVAFLTQQRYKPQIKPINIGVPRDKQMRYKLVKFILVESLYNKFHKVYEYVIIPRMIDSGVEDVDIKRQIKFLNHINFSKINKFELVLKTSDQKPVLDYIKDVIIHELMDEEGIKYEVVYIEDDDEDSTRFNEYVKISQDWMREKLFGQLIYKYQFHDTTFDQNQWFLDPRQHILYPETSNLLLNLMKFMERRVNFDAFYLVKEFPDDEEDYRISDFIEDLDNQLQLSDKLISVVNWFKFLELKVIERGWHVIEISINANQDLPPINYMLVYQLFLNPQMLLLNEEKHFPFITRLDENMIKAVRQVTEDKESRALRHLKNEYKFYKTLLIFFSKADKLGFYAVSESLNSNIEHLVRWISIIDVNVRKFAKEELKRYWIENIYMIKLEWKQFYLEYTAKLSDNENFEDFKTLLDEDINQWKTKCIETLQSNGNRLLTSIFVNHNQTLQELRSNNIRNILFIITEVRNFNGFEFDKSDFEMLYYLLEVKSETMSMVSLTNLVFVVQKTDQQEWDKKILKLADFVTQNIASEDMINDVYTLKKFLWVMVKEFLKQAIHSQSYMRDMFSDYFIDPLKEVIYNKPSERVLILGNRENEFRITIQNASLQIKKQLMDGLESLERNPGKIEEFLSEQYLWDNHTNQPYKRVVFIDFIKTFLDKYHMLNNTSENEVKFLLENEEFRKMVSMKNMENIISGVRGAVSLEKIIYETQLKVFDERLYEIDQLEEKKYLNETAQKFGLRLLRLRHIDYFNLDNPLDEEKLHKFNTLFDELNSTFLLLIKRMRKIKTYKLKVVSSFKQLNEMYKVKELKILKKKRIKELQWRVMMNRFNEFKVQIIDQSLYLNDNQIPKSVKFLKTIDEHREVHKQIIWLILFQNYLAFKENVSTFNPTLMVRKIWITPEEKELLLQEIPRLILNKTLYTLLDLDPQEEPQKIYNLFQYINV